MRILVTGQRYRRRAAESDWVETQWDSVPGYKEMFMPDKETLERAEEDKREGKAPSTQAGEFVREEIEHIREGKHGARSAKQAIAIGLSKARRAGVKLSVPKNASKEVKAQAVRDARRAG